MRTDRRAGVVWWRVHAHLRAGRESSCYVMMDRRTVVGGKTLGRIRTKLVSFDGFYFATGDDRDVMSV